LLKTHTIQRGSAQRFREHPVKIEFLLVAGASDGRLSLTANREHRHVIQFRIVQARDQVGGAGTARRQTDPDFAGKLSVAYSHEDRHLLVSDLDELDLVGPLHGSDHAVHAVVGISVNSPIAPRA
jgi:hypothetical protein